MCFVGCEDSFVDDQADAVRENTQQQAEEVREAHDRAAEDVRDQAGKTWTGEAKTDAAENQADNLEERGEQKADAIENAGENKADAIEETDNDTNVNSGTTNNPVVGN
jgi:hypothetical protein